MENKITINRLRENLWEIPASGGMKVPGRIYISEEMLTKGLEGEDALRQVMNVAHLPGIIKYSLAMPDIHWGYGFPIGGVAATDINEGVVSPGGVGYDINCGVRLAITNLTENEIKPKISELISKLFKHVPTGVGASGAIKKLKERDIKNILSNGALWSIENGFGLEEDLVYTEENGRLTGADASAVSSRAIERGLDQAGTLGSGNHFVEIDIVDEIYDEEAAKIFGLMKGRVAVLIHTGSRGLGYQVCDDYLKLLVKTGSKYNITLPDRQLACAPVKSAEGESYLKAMQAAANFAWNNRQIIMHLVQKSISSTLSMNREDMGFRLLYDVCHNIAKIEDHMIDGKKKRLCVHRKGATRAFPPKHNLIPERYKNIGQPVLIPGDMGRYSYIAAGSQKAMDETFGSSCHGAGRNLSRKKALEKAKGRDLIKELKDKGIVIEAKGLKTLAEEMSEAYKDVANVVDVMHNEGITSKVAKLRPIGVIKG
jgi:tRNA-splicing ligase RtcB (3'-phosphate/5'-hydroxy nucleic acid ligase)